MPHCERILKLIFQMQLHQQSHVQGIFQYKRYDNFYCINVTEHAHFDFPTLAKCCVDLINNSINSRKQTSPAIVNSSSLSVDTISANSGFDVFISYCWYNSRSAFENGQVVTYNGDTDPRFIKETLQANGFNCFLDVEQLGTNTKGLFQGLHTALRNTSCAVLCVSDEYDQSLNCRMELEYILRRVPCIVVAVGTGYKWKKGVIGYLTSFQEYQDCVVNAFPTTSEGVAQINDLIGKVRRVIEDKDYRHKWLSANGFK